MIVGYNCIDGSTRCKSAFRTDRCLPKIKISQLRCSISMARRLQGTLKLRTINTAVAACIGCCLERARGHGRGWSHRLFKHWGSPDLHPLRQAAPFSSQRQHLSLPREADRRTAPVSRASPSPSSPFHVKLHLDFDLSTAILPPLPPLSPSSLHQPMSQLCL